MKTSAWSMLVAGALLALTAGCGETEVAGFDESPFVDAQVEAPVDAGEAADAHDDALDPDAGEDPAENPDASEDPQDPDGGPIDPPDPYPDDPDAGLYVEPDNCVSAEGAHHPSTPQVLFRWRAGGTSDTNTPGTLTASLRTVARPSPLAPFAYAHFTPTQYYVGKAAMADPVVGITVQAWFRADSIEGSQTLFSNTEATRGFSLDVEKGRLRFAFSVNKSGSAKRYWVPDPLDPANASLPRLQIEPGRWYHASVTLHKYSDRYFVRFMVDERWAYSANVTETAPLYNSTSFPAVGAEPTRNVPDSEGFRGDIHAVVVQNYAVDRNFSTAPALRDGSAYFGLPAYHDYLGPESPGTATATPPFSNQTFSSNRRIWQADRNASWPEMIGKPRTRVGLPLLNDGYRPQGIAISANGRTLWLSYRFEDPTGANPDRLADLLVAADLPSKTVRRLYRLTQSGSSVTWKLGGLAEAKGFLYFAASGKVWRVQPSSARLENTSEPDLPGAPAVYELPVSAADAYDVSNPGPSLSYDAETGSLWLASYVADSQPTVLDRYALLPDGSGIARPSLSASDERVTVPAAVRHVQGAVRLPGTRCFLLSSFNAEVAAKSLSTTPSEAWTYCEDGTLARTAKLAPAAGGLALGHDQTAWLLFQSGATALQKRTTAEPLHDTLVPYALGFAAARLMPDHTGMLHRTDKLSVYRGDMHVHSSNSDDAAKNANPPGPPSQCFARAKTRGLDFLYLTDHVTWGWSTDAEWSACKSQSAAANTADFLAGCGLETAIGNGISNHMNVLFYEGSWRDFSSFSSHAELYRKINSKAGVVAQFNHPASDRFLWTNTAYDAAADEDIHLVEFNGGGTDPERIGKYVEFLGKGWHVAPTWNSDSHSGAETAKSAFWMRSLSAAELKAAIVGHRSFVHNTNSDTAGALKLFADDAWMGSILSGYLSAPIRLEASHPKGIARIELIGPGGTQGTVLQTVACSGTTACAKTLVLSPLPKWLFAKAVQTNGNWMISSPIWFK